MFKEKDFFAEQQGEQETKVVLEFMRHGKREKHPDPALDGGPELRLVPEGRKQSDARGKQLDPQPEVSLGWGSPRKRSQETAYRVMLANEDIGPDDSLETIEQKVNAELHGPGKHKKMMVDERLNFHNEGPIGVDGNKAYHAGKYMPWVIEDSDRDAIAKKDKDSSTYIRMAGNVAELILRYTNVGNNFSKLASQTNQYVQYGNQLERYLGTHQGVAESFVAKVLEKVKGREAKDEFVRSVGSGFAETEGVRIEIINRGSEQKIVMMYTMKDPESGERNEVIEVSSDILQEIIKDREEFEKQVLASKKV